MKYNPFSFLVEKFLAEELARADAVEIAAREEAIMKAAAIPCCTVEQRNAIFAATVTAGAKLAATMRAQATDIARNRAEAMVGAGEIARAADGVTHGRQRGPRPRKTPRVLAAMRTDLGNGFDLEGATEEEMSRKYGASRDICRKARVKALSVAN